MRPKSFDSWGDYWKFVLAKRFYFSETQNLFPETAMEKIFQIIFGCFQAPLDKTLKNIRNPLFLAGLNIALVLLITMIIYPDYSFGTVQTLLSPFFELKPWMIKFVSYLFLQIILLSLWLRTLSRLNNVMLMTAWKEKKIRPIHLGS